MIVKNSFNDIFPNLNFETKLHNGKVKYEPILRDIEGQGGYGVVIQVKDYSHTNDHFKDPSIKAMKLLKPEHALKAKVSKDFLDEIFTLSKLNHPNVTRIYDWGYATCLRDINSNETLKVPFYIMEYVEGMDLKKRIQSDIQFSLYFFEQLVSQTLSAIKCCHENPEKIIHLDIKPDNILVVENEGSLRFVLTDFGKAKFVERLDASEDGKFDTVGGGMYDYVHPKLRRYLRKDQVPIEEIKKDFEQFDLYSIGVVYKESFQKVTEFESIPKTLNAWSYFINDISWYKNDESENESPVQLLPLKTARQALVVISRICDHVPNNQIPFKLVYSEKGIPILRLPKKDTIPFPPQIAEFIDTQEFQRLRDISQLGVTEIVFPGQHIPDLLIP